MNINANFYTLSKRKNSTRKPTGAGYAVSICFKDDTDLENPTIEVHDANIKSYNYCYIDYTARYYWVSARRSIAKDTFEIDLVEDYLASAISSIFGQSCYVAMSSVDYDTELDDGRVVPVPAADFDDASCDFEIINSQSGTEVYLTQCATLITEDGIFNGVDVVYGWDAADYISRLANPTTLDTIRQRLGGGDPMDNICEIWTTPLNPAKCHTVQGKSIHINGDTYDVQCLSKLNVKSYFDTITMPRPSVSDFRYSERFVKYYLKIPYIGVITIPTELVRASVSNLLEITYGADILTGQMVFTASIRGVSLGVYGTSLKSPIALSKQGNTAAQMAISGVGGAISGAVMGSRGGVWGAIGGAAAGAALGVAGAALTTPNMEKVSSSMGSIALSALYNEFYRPTVVMIEYPADIDPATLSPVIGRPCERVSTVKNGYMQTRAASFSFAGTDKEIEQVNRLFDAGVYVE